MLSILMSGAALLGGLFFCVMAVQAATDKTPVPHRQLFIAQFLLYAAGTLWCAVYVLMQNI